MNYSTTNSSGTSSVAPWVEHFLLFPAPHGGGFVAFCALLKLIPTYIPGWGGSGFTLTGALGWRFISLRGCFPFTQISVINLAMVTSSAGVPQLLAALAAHQFAI